MRAARHPGGAGPPAQSLWCARTGRRISRAQRGRNAPDFPPSARPASLPRVPLSALPEAHPPGARIDLDPPPTVADLASELGSATVGDRHRDVALHAAAAGVDLHGRAERG